MQLPLFDEPVVAISITAVYEEAEGWRFVIAARQLGHRYEDSQAVRYDRLTGPELLDAICAEVCTQLARA